MKDVFSTELGKKIYASALRAIDDYGMMDHIKRGVLVGLSGGADSVMLLLLLLKIKGTLCDFSIRAVHINHMIRGDEADRDELFSKELCRSLGVSFHSVRIDVPAISKKQAMGLEEAARKARYDVFNDIIASNNSLSTVAVAHNATDNLETVLFNMMRGAGLAGIAGIPPVRDNIVRPLIYSSKQDITSALCESGIRFVTDSTNADNDYSRNYIRNEIIPRLSHLAGDPSCMAARMCKNLRDDNEYICSVADSFLAENMCEGRIEYKALLSMPKPIFYRVLVKMIERFTDVMPQTVHVEAVYSLLSGANFMYSLPGKIKFICENGLCYIGNDISEESPEYCVRLHSGVNEIPGYSTVVIISDDKNLECYSNIYKISIQAQIHSDIIDNGLSVRNRQDGDSYIYGGMTRKLKKLFNDHKIPPSKRQHVPVIFDNNGIVWVPGFSVSDRARSTRGAYISFAEPIDTANTKNKLYFRAEL